MKRKADQAVDPGVTVVTARSRAPAGSTERKRLTPDERERLIAKEAVSFFAKHGFEGQTRELAKQIGITQPLLYRYFPNKEALIERVYQEVFVGRWNPLWEEWIEDRSRPLQDRLATFYKDYARTILSYEWVRLFMFSGLKGLDFNARYLGLLRDRVFVRVARELRHAYGQPTLDELPMTETEAETIWGLHAAIYYVGVRRWIYGLPVPDDLDGLITGKIAAFLGGVSAVVGKGELHRGISNN
ncbi:TetR/AcrR family transcriptional regulator [Azospirillum canadense]|uniref:TetR/AcrR family transcriptional regulator n=1 Tax=Azospirillum canadense TaxID=403962 RepID=UPI002227B8E4|nr:TetR/AcrR family transcriptional regulator [Azospirillum canadense]MCW2238803.1 AcrR family transcriptional regulator [Azospirillum canadense]